MRRSQSLVAPACCLVPLAGARTIATGCTVLNIGHNRTGIRANQRGKYFNPVRQRPSNKFK
jgi:hypothetical protein